MGYKPLQYETRMHQDKSRVMHPSLVNESRIIPFATDRALCYNEKRDPQPFPSTFFASSMDTHAYPGKGPSLSRLIFALNEELKDVAYSPSYVAKDYCGLAREA
jgi:hypothetical protein